MDITKIDEVREYVQSLLYKDEVLTVTQAKQTNSIYILISNEQFILTL